MKDSKFPKPKSNKSGSIMGSKRGSIRGSIDSISLNNQNRILGGILRIIVVKQEP